MNPKPSHSNQGFTLLEMLLVVAIIAVLAGIAVVAINPGKQLATVRNTERTFNLNEIHKAMQQYFIDHYIYPAATPTTLTEICNTGSNSTSTGIDCTGLIDLSPLVPTYLTSIPIDPQGSTLSFINNFIPKVYATTNGTGYKVMKDSNNKIVLTAPQAELNAFIAIGTTTPSEIVVACPATGGATSTDGDYCINSFTEDGTFSVPSGTLTAEVLVVAGGGCGYEGGGGAGGLVYHSLYSASGNINVTVGAGGTAGGNGENSVFGIMTANGGGGGAVTYDGSPGGSGGGGGECHNCVGQLGGESTQGDSGGGTGYGYAGGNGYNSWPYSAGGGGGAGAVGVNGAPGASGAGGIGKQYSISGVATYYAGGGGGGTSNAGASAGDGGLGGGGDGTSGPPGNPGTDNTGGGGGGIHNGGGIGGNGGSGIVIVRYLKQI